MLTPAEQLAADLRMVALMAEHLEERGLTNASEDDITLALLRKFPALDVLTFWKVIDAQADALRASKLRLVA